MVQQFAVPNNETELRGIQDRLYRIAKTNHDNGLRSKFKGLKEVMFCETNIVTAIHQIKSNKGSMTAGIDKQTIDDILQLDYQIIINKIKEYTSSYRSRNIRRVWIDKPGKTEKRPLGIPTILDRIVQQCVKQILEPICEAQFYKYSFGFRPMREANMAISRIEYIGFHTECRWAIEGDIKGFFDNVNHNILLKELWNIGIHDRRVLMIIKEMLKAGIMNTVKRNDLGTPQGGILSPLLANVYLNKFDWYVDKQWQGKKTRTNYARDDHRIYALRKRSNLKPMYLIRYADDWVIMTDSKENAEKIKYKMSIFLKDSLKLKLSDEKTKITNMKKKPIGFLGFKIGLRKSKKGVKGYVNYSKPDVKRLELKIKKLEKEIYYLKTYDNVEETVRQITNINSIIRGILNYYSNATMVNKVFHKYSRIIRYKCFKKLKRGGHNPKWIEAYKSDNLMTIHENYTCKIPTIKYKELLIGVTDFLFVRWEDCKQKRQDETPYTSKGRKIYFERTNKKRGLARIGLDLNMDYLKWLTLNKGKLYNFEYFMNREYTFIRDKGKCKICGINLHENIVHIHHISKILPLNKINKVRNLVSLCLNCHKSIHGEIKSNKYSEKEIKKIEKYKERLSK